MLKAVQKLKNLQTSYKCGPFSPSSICDPRMNPSPMRSGNIIPSVAVGWDDHFLGGLEMNRSNKTDPFMIFSATATRRGRYCREKGQDVGIFRSEEGERPKLGGFFRQLVAVPQHDCHFWQPHFGRFSLPSFSSLTVVRVTWCSLCF